MSDHRLRQARLGGQNYKFYMVHLSSKEMFCVLLIIRIVLRSAGGWVLVKNISFSIHRGGKVVLHWKIDITLELFSLEKVFLFPVVTQPTKRFLCEQNEIRFVRSRKVLKIELVHLSEYSYNSIFGFSFYLYSWM